MALLFLTKDDFRAALQRPVLWAFVALAVLSTDWSSFGRTLEAALVFSADLWLGGPPLRDSKCGALVLLALAGTLVLASSGTSRWTATWRPQRELTSTNIANTVEKRMSQGRFMPAHSSGTRETGTLNRNSSPSG